MEMYGYQSTDASVFLCLTSDFAPSAWPTKGTRFSIGWELVEVYTSSGLELLQNLMKALTILEAFSVAAKVVQKLLYTVGSNSSCDIFFFFFLSMAFAFVNIIEALSRTNEEASTRLAASLSLMIKPHHTITISRYLYPHLVLPQNK